MISLTNEGKHNTWKNIYKKKLRETGKEGKQGEGKRTLLFPSDLTSPSPPGIKRGEKRGEVSHASNVGNN